MLADEASGVLTNASRQEGSQPHRPSHNTLSRQFLAEIPQAASFNLSDSQPHPTHRDFKHYQTALLHSSKMDAFPTLKHMVKTTHKTEVQDVLP